MKKLFLTIILVFFYILAYCQPQTIYIVPNVNALKAYYGTSSRLFVTSMSSDYVICNTCTVDDSIVFQGSGTRKWSKLFRDTTGGAQIIPAGIITSTANIGDNPGSNISVGDFITNTFYKSQLPTATLTGGVNLEFRSAQTMNYTLNWSAGRQRATVLIASVFVNGISQSFSQPDTSSSISGTQAVSFPVNTSITYSNVVTTTDSKTATASTTFSFLPQRYFGWINVSDTAGIGTFGYNDSKITALSQELSSSNVKSWNTGNPTGTQIYVYAYYYTAGALNNFYFNNFQTLASMNYAQRNFTNALGFVGQWIIYWNKNGQNVSSDLIAN